MKYLLMTNCLKPVPGAAKIFLAALLLLFFPLNIFCAERLDLTLEESIAIALRENLSLRSDRLNEDISHADIRVREGEFDPSLKLQLNDTYTKSPTASLITGTEEKTYTADAGIGGKISSGATYDFKWTNERYANNSPLFTLNPYHTTALTLTVTQPLLKGAWKEIQESDLNVAKNNLEIARFRSAEGADRVIADTTRFYWGLLSAQYDLEVSEISLKLAGDLLNEVKSKISSGMLAPSEIYKAEAEVALREEALLRNRKLIADAGDNLRIAMNLKDWDRDISPVQKFPVLSNMPPLESALDEALSNRKDLKAALSEKTNREIQLRFYENQRLPDLSIVGSTGLNGLDQGYSDALDRLKSGRYYSWQIGMSLTIPLGNNIAWGNIQKARYEEEKSELNLRLLKQKISAEVREAWRSLGLAVESIAATQKTKLAAEKRLEAEDARFKAGMAILTDVLKFQEEYAKAISSERQAQINLAKSLVELERVKGTLWKVEALK